MNDIRTTSVVTCPQCGFSREETMPTDACQIGYRCANCGETLRQKDGDCCVYCSYGTVPCPPMQQERSQRTSFDNSNC